MRRNPLIEVAVYLLVWVGNFVGFILMMRSWGAELGVLVSAAATCWAWLVTWGAGWVANR